MRARLVTGVLAVLALAVVGVSTRASAEGPAILPLRIHLLQSSVTELDGAGAIAASDLQDRVAAINRMFEPAGVQWQVESIRTEAVGNEAPYHEVLARGGKPAPAVRALMTPASMLAPKGFDLYVARDLSKLRIGGAYLCSPTGDGKGASIIGAQTARGRPLPTRKWAHELGHALGLSHTPCTPEFAGRLMMSSRCPYAEGDRAGMDRQEIERIRAQIAAGGPAPCTRGAPDDHD